MAHDRYGDQDGPPCEECKVPMRKGYCSRCDEFYFVSGCGPDCKTAQERRKTKAHDCQMAQKR